MVEAPALDLHTLAYHAFINIHITYLPDLQCYVHTREAAWILEDATSWDL